MRINRFPDQRSGREEGTRRTMREEERRRSGEAHVREREKEEGEGRRSGAATAAAAAAELIGSQTRGLGGRKEQGGQ